MKELPDFDRCGALLAENHEKFSRFYELLLACNEKFNLTALTERKDVYVKHFLDSLAGEQLIPENSTVAEVGSGAGFPSLPLCIAREDLSFTLIESTGKKCSFLRAVAEELGLGERTEVLCCRAEDAARASLREKFGVCVARAVAPLNTLAEYCLPLVQKGGLFLAWKGSADELPAAENAIKILGGNTERVVKFALPGGYGQRALVCVRKERPTPATYPRGNGKERRSPL